MNSLPKNVTVRLGGVVALGLVLTGVGVAPQLQARVLGDEYVVRVAPVDPIDPFRGAYVDLQYPGLTAGEGPDNPDRPGELPGRGDVYVTLVRDGDVWEAGEWTRTRPDEGPYLACSDEDWRLRCGIESWFLPQDEARAMEERVASGSARATLKIDSRGNAAVVDVR